jgi:hypothetical protein
MRWINLGGVGVVAENDVEGLSAALVAVVASGRVTGLNAGGVAVVGHRGIRGIAFGGAGVVATEGPVHGIALSLGRTEATSGRGLLLGGYRVKMPDVKGAALSVIMTRTTDLQGFAIGGYNEVRGVQRGITIGIYNRAEELHGLQIGLLNYAGNNSGVLRWLPLVNAHF